MPKKKIILTGIGASPGEIGGRVEIVNSSKEINKLKEGRIIVSSFLTPDLLPEIKKNKYILGMVTDRGGRTCHAAIVARELSIPYIVGAMNATKLLSKNKEINMDGRKGIIYEA